MSGDLEKMLRRTEFIVEANSFEMLKLWEENRDVYRMTWEQQNPGYFCQIGELGGNPVCVSLRWVILNGVYVMFWEMTSLVKDLRMWKPFLVSKNCQPRYDNGSRSAEVDAMNFHNAAHWIRSKS